MKKEGLIQIVKMVQKDINNFEMLYSKIIKKVYFWCYTILKSEADAEDASQEAIILIYKEIKMLRSPEYFTTWMYRIVTNCCYSHLRKKKNKELTFLDDVEFSENFESKLVEERREVLPKELYDLNETKHIVATFVNNLPRVQREVITLFYLEEFKIKEISNILNCSEGNIRSQLFNGRKTIEKQVNDYQKKNNTKLYTLSIWPLLGKILEAERERIYSKHNIQYKNTFNKSYNLIQKILSIVSSKIGILSSIIVIMATIIYLLFSNNNEIINAGDLDIPIISNIINEKGYQWISKIEYDENLTKDVLVITIELQKTVKSEEIKILHNNQELPFVLKGNIVTYQAYENGNYEVYVKDEILDVDITNISEYPLELIGVYNYNDYLQLLINDDLSTLDIEVSYAEYNGQVYNITDDLTIKGNFNNQIDIVLFNFDEQLIQYTVKIGEEK
ncbi:MAG: RNA polymerase sigma factor [Coprobacillaceae bacterium]